MMAVATRGQFYRATFGILSAFRHPVNGFGNERSISFAVARAPLIEGVYSRRLHTGGIRNGLDEFFQKGEDLIENAEKTGYCSSP